MKKLLSLSLLSLVAIGCAGATPSSNKPAAAPEASMSGTLSTPPANGNQPGVTPTEATTPADPTVAAERKPEGEAKPAEPTPTEPEKKEEPKEEKKPE